MIIIIQSHDKYMIAFCEIKFYYFSKTCGLAWGWFWLHQIDKTYAFLFIFSFMWVYVCVCVFQPYIFFFETVSQSWLLENGIRKRFSILVYLSVDDKVYPVLASLKVSILVFFSHSGFSSSLCSSRWFTIVFDERFTLRHKVVFWNFVDKMLPGNCVCVFFFFVSFLSSFFTRSRLVLRRCVVERIFQICLKIYLL